MIAFARRVAHLAEVEREVAIDPAGHAVASYTVTGELFFASSNELTTQFEYADDPDTVIIDMSRSHVWDASTVAALDAITTKYERRSKSVTIIGLNRHSERMHSRLSGELGAGH